MTYSEIIEAQPVGPSKPKKPLSPAQATKRANRLASAQAKLSDLRQANGIRVQAQQRKLTEI